MNEQEIQLELSNGYISSRRNAILISAIGLAWSVAQFEIGQLSIAGMTIDLSADAFPLSISALLLYLAYRIIIDYAMHPKNVRTWKLAHLDFSVTYTIIRVTLIALAASTLYRSILMMFVVVAAIIAFIAAHLLASFLLTMLAMPLVMKWRSFVGKNVSVARSALQAVSTSEIISSFIVSGILATSLFYLAQQSILFKSNTYSLTVGETIHIIVVTQLVYFSVLYSTHLRCWLTNDNSLDIQKQMLEAAASLHDSIYAVGDNYYDFDPANKMGHRRRSPTEAAAGGH